MSDLFAGGHVVDAILALILFEALLLILHHRRRGDGISPVPLLCNLLAGVFLLLALRGALVDAWWGWIALCLTLALPAHLADLWQRWKR
jgi:hypothetical protein